MKRLLTQTLMSALLVTGFSLQAVDRITDVTKLADLKTAMASLKTNAQFQNRLEEYLNADQPNKLANLVTEAFIENKKGLQNDFHFRPSLLTGKWNVISSFNCPIPTLLHLSDDALAKTSKRVLFLYDASGKMVFAETFELKDGKVAAATVNTSDDTQLKAFEDIISAKTCGHSYSLEKPLNLTNLLYIEKAHNHIKNGLIGALICLAVSQSFVGKAIINKIATYLARATEVLPFQETLKWAEKMYSVGPDWLTK